MFKKVKEYVKRFVQKIIGPVAQSERATAFNNGAYNRNKWEIISREATQSTHMSENNDYSGGCYFEECYKKLISRKLTYNRFFRDHMHPGWNAKEMVQALVMCLLSSRSCVRIAAGSQK